MLTLDHIAVAGGTLSDAAAAVEEALGVTLSPGGNHARFGTHNRLLGLEDGLYLEVIAIDPEAPAPSLPRWFDLDHFQGAPRLTNWVCRTDDLQGMIEALPGLGVVHDLQRGDLRWRMAVPETGRLPFDNLHPAVMQWQGSSHPASRLPASGCRLGRLTICHPEADALTDRLRPVLQDDRIAFETALQPRLEATFQTPGGSRQLP